MKWRGHIFDKKDTFESGTNYHAYGEVLQSKSKAKKSKRSLDEGAGRSLYASTEMQRRKKKKAVTHAILKCC